MTYKDLNLRDVINASGRMSILGVSTLSKEVIDAISEGGSRYYVMEELHEEAGRVAAQHFGAEAAYVTNSTSSGIVLSVAACIARGDLCLGRELHRRREGPRDILLMKGQNIDYGAPVEMMVELGGGLVREAGYANACRTEDLEALVTEDAAAILYVQSHHAVQKNMPTLEEVRQFSLEAGLPLIVDAAAEGDLTYYSKLADLVIYSGSKAIEGPTSGIIAGTEEYVKYVKAHQAGIGRAMKIGKESILGLMQALADYGSKTMSKEEQLEELEKLDPLKEIPGLKLEIVQDEAGREIYRGRIKIDEEEVGLSALEVTELLADGDLAVFTRDYNANIGFFDIDPRPLHKGDAEKILDKLSLILQVK